MEILVISVPHTITIREKFYQIITESEDNFYLQNFHFYSDHFLFRREMYRTAAKQLTVQNLHTLARQFLLDQTSALEELSAAVVSASRSPVRHMAHLKRLSVDHINYLHVPYNYRTSTVQVPYKYRTSTSLG